jgi:hypothetical protein
MGSFAMPEQVVFEGSKLKIARGRKHSAEMKVELASYLQDDPGAVFLELDTDTGKHRVALRFRKAIPSCLSAIFGDAIHNFRTALDVLANDLVALSGVKPEKVYFPFGKNSTTFESELKAKMGQAPADIQAIVRSFKPYIGGNEVLRAMHDLDIGDKHIAMLKIGYTGLTGALPMKQTGSSPLPGGGGRLSFEVDMDAIKTIPIDMTGFPDEPPYKTIGKMVGSELKCIIAPDFPLANTPVIKALNDIGNISERIVKTFEAHCFGSKQAPIQ